MIENSLRDPFASTSINYWAIVCRRRWWLLWSLAAAWAVAFATSHLIPPIYTSRALVLVSRTGIPQSYVELNVNADLAERMRNISERVFDHAHLEKIIADFNLYPGLRVRLGPEQVVNAMRRDIAIDPLPADDAAANGGNEDPAQAARRALVPQNGKTPDAIAFRLSYSAPDRILAQQVTSELLALMIEENMKERRKQSEITTNFLRNQADQMLDELNLQQKHIQEFKSHYMGELPDQRESNLQALSQFESRLQSANDALARAEQQRIYLASLSGEYKELEAGLASDKGTSGSPDTSDRQLEKLEKQLDDLKARYTDSYPEVRSLREEISRLKAAKAAPSTPATSTAVTQPPMDPPPSLPRPKTYSELQALSPILQIDSQVKSNEAEITNRQNEVKAIEGEIAHYQALLNNTPLREQQLNELTRTSDQLKATYDSLATKASQSQLATDLEKHQQGEQWEILTAPEVPRKPSFPDRFLFSLAGLGAGVALGIGLVVYKEHADDSILEEEDLRAVGRSDLRILASVPLLRTPREKKVRYLKVAYEFILGTGIIITIAGATTWSFFR